MGEPTRDVWERAYLLHAYLILGNGVIEARHEGLAEVAAVVDATVVGEELLKSHLMFDRLGMGVRVEHDERECEDVPATWRDGKKMREVRRAWRMPPRGGREGRARVAMRREGERVRRVGHPE